MCSSTEQISPRAALLQLLPTLHCHEFQPQPTRQPRKKDASALVIKLQKPTISVATAPFFTSCACRLCTCWRPQAVLSRLTTTHVYTQALLLSMSSRLSLAVHLYQSSLYTLGPLCLLPAHTPLAGGGGGLAPGHVLLHVSRVVCLRRSVEPPLGAAQDLAHALLGPMWHGGGGLGVAMLASCGIGAATTPNASGTFLSVVSTCSALAAPSAAAGRVIGGGRSDLLARHRRRGVPIRAVEVLHGLVGGVA